MNTRRPEPGSAWERHCPEAFPRGWLAGDRELPDGFTRAATGPESELITGTIAEAAYLAATQKPPQAVRPVRKKRRKVNPVVRKIRGYRQFFDGLVGRANRLSPLAALLWLWLWNCEKDGVAMTSERKLSQRFGVGRTALRRRLHELEQAGYMQVIERGTRNRRPTLYRLSPSAKLTMTGAQIAPVTGAQIAPLTLLSFR